MKGSYYVLNDNDKEAIEYHKKTFLEIDNIGIDILDSVLNKNDKIENYWIPIRSILYRLLEFNDTLNIMVQNSLINTAFPILRSEFEIFIQMLFLLKNPNEIEKKALLYHYCDIRRMNDYLEKEELDEFLFKHEYLLDIHQEYMKSPLIDKNNWYSIYEKKKISFKILCASVGKEDYYNRIYSHLSADTHSTGCIELNTIFEPEDNKYYLLNFRSFERNDTLMIYHIDFFRNVFLSITNHFDTEQRIKAAANDFYYRAESYINCYLTLKSSYLFDPTSRYSI